MKKKVFAALLSAAMVMSMMTACGNEAWHTCRQFYIPEHGGEQRGTQQFRGEQRGGIH